MCGRVPLRDDDHDYLCQTCRHGSTPPDDDEVRRMVGEIKASQRAERRKRRTL